MRAATRRERRDPHRAPTAVILAGGTGTRLRPLTRQIVGDDRPKQFCPIVGRESLLDQTRRRAALAIAPGRTLIVLTREHEPYYRPLVGGVPRASLVIQPEARGTAPAILYALMRVASVAPASPVVLLPSDHWVSDDAAFMAHVLTALEVERTCPDRVILLGIAAARAEIEYGWIEPGEPIFGPWSGDVYRVRRFVEKPGAALARSLHAGGCLWNSFVLVGQVAALLAMIDETVPSLFDAFVSARAGLGTPDEGAVIERLYCGLPPADFSTQVLGGDATQLGVLAVKGVEWDDLGDPSRVAAARERSGQPARLQAAS